MTAKSTHAIPRQIKSADGWHLWNPSELQKMTYFSDEDAIEIWKAKWRGEGVQSLVERYKKSPFRFYEVWTETKNSGTRLIAFEQFKHEEPHLALHVDNSPHTPKRKVIVSPPKPPSSQLDMFG